MTPDSALRCSTSHTERMATRKSSRTGQETKDKILDAALATVQSEGLVGTSARAIAKMGDFNQALVFYHFGSVEELLLAALQRANARRMARFEERLRELDNLPDLVQIGRELHASPDDPDHAALSAIVAGWSSSSELGHEVLATLQPWNDLMAAALRRVLAEHPLGKFVPTEELAYALAGLFLGIEMMGRLEPDEKRTEAVFAALAGLATFAGPVLDSMEAPNATS